MIFSGDPGGHHLIDGLAKRNRDGRRGVPGSEARGRGFRGCGASARRCPAPVSPQSLFYIRGSGLVQYSWESDTLETANIVCVAPLTSTSYTLPSSQRNLWWLLSVAHYRN